MPDSQTGMGRPRPRQNPGTYSPQGNRLAVTLEISNAPFQQDAKQNTIYKAGIRAIRLRVNNHLRLPKKFMN